ncbi:hypothetical protein LN042_22960 [Kitasatospora sp. RB6PN24]|uniref:hypothetical protein n=1 Tax=Kitasatospora humi TaxID=2893891 RepID=UPI001E5A0F28|nr:hypothetical protein [Kitasatospora humi]MCC9309896.1 hypothetical protein [Kitasatospora humi]
MITKGVYFTYWSRYGQAPVRLECPATLSPWEHQFPRFYVRYSGWSCHRHMDLATEYVAERAAAEQQRAALAAELPGWWVGIVDVGPAPFPEFRMGVEFFAADGRKGFIAIRNRHGAAVQWLDGPLGLNPYPLDLMRTEPPEPMRPAGSTWLRG